MALSNARTAKPAAFAKAEAGDNTVQKNNDRLCQIQGWEMCEMAIMAQVLAPHAKRAEVPQTYPDPKPPKPV